MIRRMTEYLSTRPWIATGLAVIGGLVYAWRTWVLAHRLTTMILDESMYVYKGYLFVSGQYAAYQDYGPLTNHMPLSFIIPGFVQTLFGLGMGTARVFSFFVGLVMLTGIWLAVYRLSGKWWAAGVVWIFALNPVWQEVFSQALTQGLVNAFVIWGFVLLIGKERKYWQLALSGGLMALAVMTRINILPMLALAVVYVFWQHGWRKGLAAAVSGLIVGLVVIAFFWPEVLKFLAGWIPEGLLGFVEPFRSPWRQQHVPEGFSYLPISAWWDWPGSDQWSGVKAFYEAINFNLIPFLLVFGTLVFWPKKDRWPARWHSRLSVTLVTIWLLMAGMHIWVALSGRSCRFFCLSGYFTFFNLMALLLIPAALPYWRKRPPKWRGIVGLAALFGTLSGALYAAGLRPTSFARRWYSFMETPIPRISGGKVLWNQRGPLLSLLEAWFNLSYKFLVEELPRILYWPTLVLLILGLTLLLYLWVRKRVRLKISWAWLGFVVFLGIALAGGPFGFYEVGSAVRVCEDDVIASHEQVGAELSKLIEPGSQVYWDLTSNMLLLYLPDVEIFPPQLNTSFNFVDQSAPSESDEIYRFGYWDETLKQTWLDAADYVIISNRKWDDLAEEWNKGEWRRIARLGPYESCRPLDTYVYVMEAVRADD